MQHMKHSFFLLLVLCFCSLQLAAQKASRQYSGKVKYQKTEQDATVFDVPYPADQVEDGMKDMFQKKGVKVKEKSGFFEAQKVKMDQLGNKTGDVYYKVVKDGKNDSKIYVILTEAGEAPENRTSSHSTLALGAGLGTGAILGGIAPALDEHDFNVVKTRQEEEIKRTEKRMSSLLVDQGKLEKKRADLDKDIEKLKQDQINLSVDLEAKKSALATFLEKAGKGKKN
jgi:hypothetical protein